MKSLLGKLGVILIGLAIFGFFVVSPANAGATLKMYESIKNTQTFKLHINVVGVGLSWANAELERTGRPPLYCEPMKMPLQAENYLQILQDYIQKNKELINRCGPDCPVEMLLLHGLMETFPCK